MASSRAVPKAVLRWIRVKATDFDLNWEAILSITENDLTKLFHSRAPIIQPELPTELDKYKTQPLGPGGHTYSATLSFASYDLEEHPGLEGLTASSTSQRQFCLPST